MRASFLCLVCTCLVVPSLGSAFEVHQLTDSGNNFHPSVNDGWVTWIRRGAEGNEIMLSNLKSAVVGIAEITDDGGEKEHPSNIGGTKIVWQGRAEGSPDWEIWVYYRYGIPRWYQLTDNEVADRYPSVGAGGNIAWQSGDVAIHYWNEHLHRESVISDTCCPVGHYDNYAPSYHHYGVVWRAYDLVGSNHGLRYWDGATTQLAIPDGSAPFLYRETVAYTSYVEGDWPILYWDGAEVHRVTTNDAYNPSLYDGRIAYEQWSGGNSEIFFWDGSETVQVTDNDYDDTQPSYDGSRIAWVGRPGGGGTPDHIFYTTGLPEPEAATLAVAALLTLAGVASRRRGRSLQR